MIEKRQFYINGSWVNPAEGRDHNVIDPSTEDACAIISLGGQADTDAAVAAANKWLSETNVKLISIETVVLPNIWSKWEEGSGDASIGTSGDSPSRWHQFLRCWYHD